MSQLKYNLSAAVIANQYVKSKMTIGASNKLRVNFCPRGSVRAARSTRRNA
jgi:hypothetical protein